MKFIADLHIHSHYSLATSKQLIPEYLNYWAKIKGISVVGTGDFTHPGWLTELEKKTEPAEQGLYKLKPEYADTGETLSRLTANIEKEVRFLLTAEISNIYKKNGKTRKVHNVVLAPDFETVEKVQYELKRRNFNITSDGRPILGLDAEHLLEILLNISEDIFFIPAHIWTPWFSALGAKSGFDSIEECYGDLTKYIYAVETGLSSDPPMNWICSKLDRFNLISNSDAHSPEKLGRNANLFNCDLSYDGITSALKNKESDSFTGTIDLYPQEGKYHYDGHRKCNVCSNPLETLKNRAICPVCGRKVTVGVMHRVAQLADRTDFTQRPYRKEYKYVIPLKEILSEIYSVGSNAKKIAMVYNKLIHSEGAELDILLEKPIKELEKKGHELLAEAIRRMRNGEIFIKEGFDGEYGEIKVFKKEEIETFGEQKSLFGKNAKQVSGKRKAIDFDLEKYREVSRQQPEIDLFTVEKKPKEKKKPDLDIKQKRAAEHYEKPALIIAGPGTGKTRVLTYRVLSLLKNRKIKPENILAITFTNKAANEMSQRLNELLIKKKYTCDLTVSTFHAFGSRFIDKNLQLTKRKQNYLIINTEEKKLILQQEVGYDSKQVKKAINEISRIKQQLLTYEQIEDREFAEIFRKYQETLENYNLFDLDDLLYIPVLLLSKNHDVLNSYREKYQWIMVDEYQDINYAQYRLICLLAPDNNSNLVVIGDPNQAIYSFRGADVGFIKQFTEDFDTAEIYELTKSYRCSNVILKASQNIIKNSKNHSVEIKGLSKGVEVKIVRNPTDRSEAEYVARTIENLIGGLRFFSMDSKISSGEADSGIESLSDFAVLCRTKAQMDVFKEAFNNHAIPYQETGNKPFFRTEPIASVVDMLRLSMSPDNMFLRKKLRDKHIIGTQAAINTHTLFTDKSVKNSIASLIENYFLHNNSDNEVSYRQLIDLAAEFGNDFDGFLRYISIGTGLDTHMSDIETVSLMTMHASKGLEFNCVFITGCEDGLLPYSLYNNKKVDIEEERRLLYVGMTRAKKYLFLTHADKRNLKGREYLLRRSRFIDNIQKRLIELQKAEHKKIKKTDSIQQSLF